jgi:uncharacterized protein (DUF433 family)
MQVFAWIGGTKVKVAEVVLDQIAHGWSPEEIHLQHPNLSLAQVYGALTANVSDADFRRKLQDLKRSA